MIRKIREWIGKRLLWPKGHVCHQHSAHELGQIVIDWHCESDRLCDMLREALELQRSDAWEAYVNAPDYATARRAMTRIIREGL